MGLLQTLLVRWAYFMRFFSDLRYLRAAPSQIVNRLHYINVKSIVNTIRKEFVMSYSATPLTLVPRLIRPAPDPLGLYFRVGRNDHRELLDLLDRIQTAPLPWRRNAVSSEVRPSGIPPRREAAGGFQLIERRMWP